MPRRQTSLCGGIALDENNIASALGIQGNRQLKHNRGFRMPPLAVALWVIFLIFQGAIRRMLAAP